MISFTCGEFFLLAVVTSFNPLHRPIVKHTLGIDRNDIPFHCTIVLGHLFEVRRFVGNFDTQTYRLAKTSHVTPEN